MENIPNNLNLVIFSPKNIFPVKTLIKIFDLFIEVTKGV